MRVRYFSLVSIDIVESLGDAKIFPKSLASITISPPSFTSASITDSIPISKSFPIIVTRPFSSALIYTPSKTARLERDETALETVETAELSTSLSHTNFI